MKKLPLALSVATIVFLASCQKNLKDTVAPGDLTTLANANGGNATAIASDSAEHVPNQLLIRFKKGLSASGRTNALARITGRVQEHVLTGIMERLNDEGFYVVNTPLNALEALQKAKGAADIQSAELNYIYTHYQTASTSTDPYYTNKLLWGMYGPATTPANLYGSNASAAWSAGMIGLKSTYVGIIDEGVMNKHLDLSANVDATKGWDFANNDATTYDGYTDDHGTHVAGTIGALGNSTGVVGVNWNVTMIPAKFIGSRGGTTANAIKSIDHFTNLKNQGLPIIATNNSWGGPGYSKELELAIGRADAAGILFVCAAGNDGRNIDDSRYHTYPACYYNPNTIVVAALTSGGAKASYSNYGLVGTNTAFGSDPNHSFVDMAAPGSGIYSTVPDRKGTGSVYASYDGTSMATPHVTGAIALYAASKNLTTITQQQAYEIKAAILNSARPTKSFSPISAQRLSYTGARLDAFSAIKGDNNTGLIAD